MLYLCIKRGENTQVLNHEINEDAIITNMTLSWLATTLAYRLWRLFTQAPSLLTLMTGSL